MRVFGVLSLFVLGAGCGWDQSCRVNSPDGIISGQVRDDEGPWAGVEVIAKTGSGTETAVTDDDGRFSFALEPGRVKVWVEAERGFTTEPHTGCCGYSECRGSIANTCTPDAMLFEWRDCEYVD